LLLPTLQAALVFETARSNRGRAARLAASLASLSLLCTAEMASSSVICDAAASGGRGVTKEERKAEERRVLAGGCSQGGEHVWRQSWHNERMCAKCEKMEQEVVMKKQAYEKQKRCTVM